MKLILFLVIFIRCRRKFNDDGHSISSKTFKKSKTSSLNSPNHSNQNHYFPNYDINGSPTPTPAPTILIKPEDMEPLVDERREDAIDYQREFLAAQININKMKQLDPAVYAPKRPILQIPTQNKKIDPMIQDTESQKINVMYPRFCCKCVFRKYFDVSQNQKKKINALNKKIKKYKKILKLQNKTKQKKDKPKQMKNKKHRKSQRTTKGHNRRRDD